MNAATLTNVEAESYGRAIELLRPTGDALLTAVERYVEAAKLLGGGSRLIEAVKSFLERDGFPSKFSAKVSVAWHTTTKPAHGAIIIP